MKIDIATGSSKNARFWKNHIGGVEWNDLVVQCSKVHRTHETFKQYQAETPEFRHRVKDIGGFVSGFLAEGRRTLSSVVYKQVVTLDADNAEPGFWEKAKSLGVTCMYYTTHSHSPEAPRVRLLVLLDRPATPLEYEPIARYIAYAVGIEQVDPTSYDLNRLMFWPSASSDGEFLWGRQDTFPVSADLILKQYSNWMDASSWPMGEGEKMKRRSDINALGDPTLKPGIVGMFCRLYPISRAISTFLSDKYVSTDDPERYTYLKGSTGKGLRVYDDLHAYSHHGTDPTSGLSCNAFDLLRYHLFGAVNDDTEQSMGKRKSFIECSDFVRQLPEIREHVNLERFKSAAEEFIAHGNVQPGAENHVQTMFNPQPGATVSQPMQYQPQDAVSGVEASSGAGGTAWLGLMNIDKRGTNLSTLKNMKLVLENDPNLKGCFAFDDFSKRGVLLRAVPWWRPGRDTLHNDTDDAFMREYLETNYGISGKEKLYDALAIVAEKAAFHPVREYLKSIKWDGKPRIETLFHEYLGAADTPYTRLVSRKWFAGAVARIFEPGVKFDNMLIFVGDEGVQKSTMVSVLAGDWFSETPIDMRDKKGAMEELQGVWIMEWAELTSFRTGTVEAVKAFVSKKTDRFRSPYGRRTQNYPRQCIFMGSTNLREFLSDPTGNRRFWPVVTMVCSPVKTPADHLATERDQIWAEACVLYAQGERLYLTKTESALAKQVQLAHTETDDRASLVQAYLDAELPVEWKDMDGTVRNNFLLNGVSNIPLPGSNRTIQRERVCIAELWTEVLQGAKKDMNRMNTRILRDIMNNMEGWVKYEGTLKFGEYGMQRGYVRESYLAALTLNPSG